MKKLILIILALGITSFVDGQNNSELMGSWTMKPLLETSGYPYSSKKIQVSNKEITTLTFNNDGTYYYGEKNKIHFTYYYSIDASSQKITWSPSKTEEKTGCIFYKFISKDSAIIILDGAYPQEQYHFNIYLLVRN